MAHDLVVLLSSDVLSKGDEAELGPGSSAFQGRREGNNVDVILMKPAVVQKDGVF